MIFRKRLASETDATLVSRVAKGDENAFGELLRRHQASIYRFALSFLKDPQEAEEIAQEVFLRLYRTASGYKSQAALRTYLFRIARNLCIDAIRKKRPETMDELPETADEETAFEKLDQAQSMQRLEDAVAHLPDNQRAAIMLRHDQDLSYRQIAESLNITVKAVESLLVRARRTLREQLPDLC